MPHAFQSVQQMRARVPCRCVHVCRPTCRRHQGGPPPHPPLSEQQLPPIKHKRLVSEATAWLSHQHLPGIAGARRPETGSGYAQRASTNTGVSLLQLPSFLSQAQTGPEDPAAGLDPGKVSTLPPVRRELLARARWTWRSRFWDSESSQQRERQQQEVCWPNGASGGFSTPLREGGSGKRRLPPCRTNRIPIGG